MNLVLFVAGSWMVCDGIGSILVYERQSAIEHAVRVIRSAIGVIVAFYAAILL